MTVVVEPTVAALLPASCESAVIGLEQDQVERVVGAKEMTNLEAVPVVILKVLLVEPVSPVAEDVRV